MHIKRTSMPKTWPIARKSTTKKYVAVPTHAKTKSITLLYLLRDMLKISETRRELKKIILNGDVKVNDIVRKKDTYPIQVFDTISLEKVNKYYRLQIINKKFTLTEIRSKEVLEKIVKIIGKKSLTNKKIQINFEDGTNLLTKESFNVGDSAIISQKNKKIVKILPLKTGSNIEIISGKHAGKKGKLLSFEKLARDRIYEIKLNDGLIVNLPYKTILVIE
jgi:small subunit ribosomal protein S4e